MRNVLLLYRNYCDESCCKGVLFKLAKVNFLPFANTLEPALKVNGKDGLIVGSGAALPHGRYKVRKMFSKKFNMFCFRVVEPSVADRAILIHMGNTLKDTSGCILVGENWRKDKELENSRKAFAKLPNFDEGYLYILNPDDKLSALTEEKSMKLALQANNHDFFEIGTHNIINFED